MFCFIRLTIYPRICHFSSCDVTNPISIGSIGDKCWCSVDLCGSYLYHTLALYLFTRHSVILSFSVYKIGIMTLLRAVTRISKEERTCVWIYVCVHTHMNAVPGMCRWLHIWCSVKKSCYCHLFSLSLIHSLFHFLIWVFLISSILASLRS